MPAEPAQSGRQVIRRIAIRGERGKKIPGPLLISTAGSGIGQLLSRGEEQIGRRCFCGVRARLLTLLKRCVFLAHMSKLLARA